MCLRSSLLRALILILLLALSSSPVFARDDLSSYLEQRGLKQLLVIYLEQQLESPALATEHRHEITLKLASLYAELLESTSDPAQRLSLEERSRKLLTSVPASSSDDLRLALMRNTYRAAEKTAEAHRLRLSNEADIETARRNFADLVPPLNALRLQIKQQAEVTDRRLGRSTGSEAITLQQSLDRLRSRYAQCTFLAAWSMYYQGWLTGQREIALAAEPLFAELLGVETSLPEPQDVPNDSRSEEWAARSILGLALCKSITESASAAQQWLDLLEQPNVFEVVRTQVPAWRLAVHLENGHYVPALEILKEKRAEGDEIPIAWIRLAAAQALDDKDHTMQASDLAHFAVLELAARGELEQIIDLANRYGTDALGGSGFALHYVRGMIKYQKAREAHGADQPTLDAEKCRAYQEAATSLKAAISEKDAERFAAPAASCRLLIAWCSYFCSQYLEAKNLFLQASEKLETDEASESMWMAIVCLDKLVQADANASLRSQQASLIEQFLAKYPSNEHAAKLVLRRALATDEISPKAVSDLLSVPHGSDVYIPAQRRAADMLYQMFRAATGQQKVATGRQYLTVAMGLIDEATKLNESSEEIEIARAMARCRRVLEVALSDGIDDLSAVRQALGIIEQLAKLPTAATGDYAQEVEFRRGQERLLSEDVDGASAIAENLWTNDAESLWSRLAARAMFQHGQRMWKDEEASTDDRQHGLELVVRHGGRVLREYAEQPDALEQSSVLGYHAAVAVASMKLYEDTGDAERGRAALFLFEKLLASKPRNATFLRSTAVLSERFGDTGKAINCWRSLASGSPQGSEGWYEAKYRLISLLASRDPHRARQVIDQHKQLYPDYGPEPWGGRLRGLDQYLSQSRSTTTAPATAPVPAETQMPSSEAAPASP